MCLKEQIIDDKEIVSYLKATVNYIINNKLIKTLQSSNAEYLNEKNQGMHHRIICCHNAKFYSYDVPFGG